MIDTASRERTLRYIHARQRHPAWVLMASRRAPLVLSALQALFEQNRDGVALDDALLALAGLLEQHANNADFEIGEADFAALARKELRAWIKRELVVEREGRLHATDALEKALAFVDALEGRFMTTTASRLSVVQREIENLESSLNPDPQSRVLRLRRQIAELEKELEATQSGRVAVPDRAEAEERIREIYVLAIGLRADFRRVEDSWREADRLLRHSIVNEQQHRGAILDRLLDGHDVLLDTPEGRVFHGFQQQLGQSVELEAMKQRLRAILQHPSARTALSVQQQSELRWLVMRLVKESQTVIRARARSERDVKSFLRTGLAAEHHRVGALLNELFAVAQRVSWERQSVRRKGGPLPPIAIANSALPLIERLRFKSLDSKARDELELRRSGADLDQVEEDFWSALDGLDRKALLDDTLTLIGSGDTAFSVGDLARELPPTHDLETLALWLGLAREADVAVGNVREQVDMIDRDGRPVRFLVPVVELTAASVEGILWEV